MKDDMSRCSDRSGGEGSGLHLQWDESHEEEEDFAGTGPSNSNNEEPARSWCGSGSRNIWERMGL